VVHAPASLADQVVAEITAAASAAGSLLFRELPVDFPLNVSVVRSYADAGKPGGTAPAEV
jgi:DNA polymerase-1